VRRSRSAAASASGGEVTKAGCSATTSGASPVVDSNSPSIPLLAVGLAAVTFRGARTSLAENG
jgi:hypothetical protein